MENSVEPKEVKDDALIVKLRKMFEEAEEASISARALAEKSRDYYDGDQLTEEEQSALKKRKQPPVVINRIRRKVDWLRGLEMQARTDPKAYPRTPKHTQGAEAVTDAIRYVCDNTDWDLHRSMAWQDILISGIGGVEVVHKETKKGVDIVIRHYHYDRLFHDPHSVEPNFSDASYIGAVIWSDIAALKDKHADKEEIIESSINQSDATSSDSLDDKPKHLAWSDPRRKRVRVVLMHYKQGDKWLWAKYVHGGILDGGESLYIDDDGESQCPLIMQSAYIDKNNNRYGIIKDMIDPQDEINKRRSKLLHQLNSRQTMAQKGAIANIPELKKQLASPDGHVEYSIVDPNSNRQPFEILPQTDQTGGQFNLLQEAKSEIDLMGANSGLAGKDGSGESGRAILARQQGGMIEIAPLTDGLSQFTREVYRQVWSRIRQFWKEEKWVRVTDDERNVRFVGFNRKVTLLDKLKELPPEQAAQFIQQNQIQQNDPRLQEVVENENSVEEMDVDILIEEVPDQVSLQSETFEQLVNLSTSMPGVIPPDILIESAPNLKRDIKDKLLERMEQQMQMQSQMGQQAQEMAMQIDGAKAQAQIAKDQASAEKTAAEAQRVVFENQQILGAAEASIEQ